MTSHDARSTDFPLSCFPFTVLRRSRKLPSAWLGFVDWPWVADPAGPDAVALQGMRLLSPDSRLPLVVLGSFTRGNGGENNVSDPALLCGDCGWLSFASSS